jgi:nucleoid-associated protein YgaU
MTRTIPARLVGLTATLAILAILAGLPAMLLAIGANPIPDHVPTLEQIGTALTSRDDGTLTLRLLAVVAWAGWAFLTGTITLEVLSRLRHLPTPHLPALALPQSAARTLVGAAVLLFAAGPALPTPSAAATDLVAATVPASTTPAPAGSSPVHSEHDAKSAQAAAGDHTPAGPRTHTVTTGESLWSIAATELGDGARWHEIAHLNPATHGPQWRVYPGTTLTIPASDTDMDTAAGAAARRDATYTVRSGDTLSEIAQDRLGDADRYPEIFAASRHTRQADGRHLRDPDLILPGWHLTIPGTGHTHARTAPAAAGPQLRAVPGSAAPDAGGTTTTPEGPGPATEPPTADHNTVVGTRTPRTASPTTTQPHPAAEQPGASAAEADDGDDADAPPWLLAGLAGGPVLAGSLWMLLRRRRAAQTRHRRPGRTIATPPPVVAPVEKTLASIGAATEDTIELVDQALRALASHHTAAHLPMPSLAALQISRTHLTLHLRAAADLPAPWADHGNRTRWALPADTDPADLGEMVPDQPAPYPLLVTIGTSDTGEVWLYNFEDLTITVTGDHTYGTDFARYLAAEIACNPWSAAVTVHCVGVATEVAPINPDRVRVHTTGPDPAADVLADAVHTIDRAGDHHDDVVTARAHQAGADTWDARLLLLDATTQPTPALTQLLTLLDQHPGATATSVVLAGGRTQPAGTILQITSTGRVRLPQAGLDLVAVGLTSDEARGCAALVAAGEDLNDQPIPTDDRATHGWRAYTDAAGALGREHTIPRDTPPQDILGDTTCLLPAPDQDYTRRAATTTEDLADLAPQVPTRVRQEVQGADPNLDADVAAWFAEDCALPRLALLGPVRARTRGRPLAKRKPYMTAVLAYLSSRPHGVTPDELADAMNVSVGKARVYATVIREWLGTNPRTGEPHLPDARRAPEAQTRGIGVYQVQDLLVDADLFRRLRLRGQTRGAEGIPDLIRALDLVQGPPFSQVRADAWNWLYEGDRLDHHLTYAIVDVAHLVITHALHKGDIHTARAAVRTALRAAPAEEVARLDLAAVGDAEGRRDEMRRFLRAEVFNRTDDDGPPPDLPTRTQKIADDHGWGRDDSAVG